MWYIIYYVFKNIIQGNYNKHRSDTSEKKNNNLKVHKKNNSAQKDFSKESNVELI